MALGVQSLGVAQGLVSIDTAAAQQSMNNLANNVDGVKKNISNSMQAVGQSMTRVGTMMSLGVTAPIVAMGAKAIDSFAKFQRALALAGNATGATAVQMEALRQKAFQLGKDTAFSAGEAAQGIFELGKSGFDADQALSGIEGTLMLAAAAQIEVAEAAGVSSNMVAAFGLEAADLGKVVDSMTGAVNNSPQGFSELNHAMNTSAGTFGSYGLSIDDLTTSLAVMANTGLMGQRAGTGINRMLMELSNPRNDAAAAMIDELGISIWDASGNMVDMETIVGQLNGGLEGMTTEQKNLALATIFGNDALHAANRMAAITADEFGEMYTQVTRAGQAAELSETIMGGLAGAFDYFRGTLDTMLIQGISPFGDAMANMVRWVADLIAKFGDMSSNAKKWIAVLLGVAAAIGPILMGLGPLLTFISTLGFLISPVTLVIGAIVLLGFYLGKLFGWWDSFDDLKSKVVGFFNNVDPIESFSRAVEKVSNGVKGFIELWKNEDYEKGFFQGLSTSIADVGSAIGDELIYRFALLGNVITENIPFVNTLRESVWDFRKVMTQRQDLPFFERLMTATRAAGLVIKTGLVDEFIKFETRMTEAVPGSQVLFDTIWRFQKTMDTSDLPFFEKLNLAISEAGESINSELIYRFALLGNALTENIPLAKTLWDAYNVFGRAMNVNKELPYFERLKASIQETSTMLWVEFSNSKLVGDIVYPFAILGNAITENIPFVNTLRESVFKFRQVMTQQQDLTFFERLGVAAYEASLIIGDELIYRFALLGNALTENIPLAKTLWDAYNVFGRAMNVNKELPYFERLKASIQETSTMLWVEFSNSKLVGDIVYPFAILGNAITENIPFVNTLRESVFKFRQVMTQQQDLTFFERLGVAAYEASLIIGDELIYRFALLGNALTENIPLAKTLWDAYNVFGRAMNVNKELPYFERLKASIQETSTMLWVEFSNSKLVGDIVYPFAILGNAITENIPFVNTLRESVFKFRQVMTQQQDLPLFERLGVAAHEASLIIGDELIYRLALLGNVITENIPFVNTLRESVFKFRQVMTQQQDLPFFERLGVAAHEASLIIGDELIYRLALFGNVLTENIPLAKTLWDAYNVFGRAMNVNKELPYFERLKASIQETSTMLWVEFSNSKLVGDIVYPFAILGNVITENIPLIQSAREAMQNFSRTMTMDQELPFWDRLKKAITESSHMFWVEWINSDFVGDIVYPFAILGNAITENIPFVNTLRESVFKFRQVMTQKQDLPFFERLGVAAHEASLIIGDELIHRLALLGNVITENIPFVNTLRESVFKFRQVMTQNKDLPFFKRLKLAVKESTNIIGKYIQKFFKNVFKKLKIKDALKDLRAKFLKLFDVGSFTELWEKFSTSWNEGWESIFQESDAIRDDIKYWFSETWENAVETVTEFWNTFSVAWKKGWEKIFSGEANFIKDIKSWFANAWDQSVETVTEFWNTFSVAWKKGWEKILEDSEDIKEDIKSWFANAWDQSVETVTEFWNTFSVAWKEGWSKVEDKVEDFFDDFSVAWKEGWSKAFKKLEDFISDIGDVDWGGVLDNVSDTASDWGSVIRQWISNAWYWVRDNVLDWGSVLTQTLKNVWTWITGIAKEWGTKFRDWITESWTWLKDNASTKSKEWGDLLVLVIEVAWNNITEIGKNWGKHIRRWISSAWTWVKDNPLGAEWGLTLDTILENAWTNISKIYESWGENIRGWISSAWTWVKDNPLGAEWGLTLDTILENAWTNISDIYESWGENIRGWISSAWTWVKDNPLQTEWGKLLIASLAYAFVGGSALAGTWGSIISGWLNQAWIDAGESISGWSFEDSFEWPTIPKFELGWDVREVLTEVQTTITNAWKEFRETLAYIFGAPMEVITDPDQVNAEWDQLVSDSHKFLEDSEAGFSHIDKFMWPTIPEFTLGWDVSKVLSGVGDTITNAWSSFRSSVSHIFGKGSRDVEQESEANLKTRSGIGDPRSDFEQYWTEDDLKRIRQSEELMAEVAASKERTDAILKGVVDDFKTGMDLGAIQGEKNAEEFIESIESFEWPTIPEFTLGWDIGAVLTEVQTTISAAWNGFIVDIKSLLGIDGEGNSAVTDIFKWPTIPEFELGWDVSGVLTAVGDTITNAWSAFRGSLSHIFGSGMKEVEKETKLLSELPEPSMYEKRIDFGDPRHVVEPFWTEKDLKGLEAAAANREGFMKALGGREFMPEDEADANNKALLENHRKYIAETEAAMSAQQESFEWPDIPKFEISWNLTETFDSARETITGAWNAFVEGIKAAIGITAYSVTSIFMWPEIPKFELGWDVSEVLTGVGDTISTAWSSFRSSVSHIFGKGSRDVEQESEENLKTRSSVGDPRSDFEQYWTEDDLKRIRQSEELMAEVAASKERTDAILKGVVDDFKTGMDLGAIQGEKNAEEFIESIESFEWPTIPEFTLGWDIGAVLTEVQTKISTAWNGFIVDIKSLLGIDGEGNSAVTDIFKWPTIPEFTLGWDVSEVLTEVQTTITNAWKAFRGSLSHIFGSGVKEVEKETKLLSELPEPSMYEKRIDFGDPRHVVEPFWTEKDLKGLEAAAANREGFMKALGGREFMPEDEADANNKALLENHRKYIAETEAAMSAQQESFEWPDIPKFEISWNLTETFDSARETITGAWNAFVEGIKAAIGITAYSVTSIFMWPEIPKFELGWDVSEVLTGVGDTISTAWSSFRSSVSHIFGKGSRDVEQESEENLKTRSSVGDPRSDFEQYWTEDDLKRIRQSEELMAEVAASKERTDAILKGVVDDFKTGMDLGAIQGEKNAEEFIESIESFEWPTIPEFTLGWDIGAVLTEVQTKISTAWNGFIVDIKSLLGIDGEGNSAVTDIFKWPTIPEFTLGWDVSEVLTEVQTTITNAWKAFRGSLSHIFGSGVKEVEKETKLLSELPEPSMYEKRIDFGDPRHVVEPFWTEKDLKGLEAAAANREGFMKALGGREFMPEDEADANNKALLENHRKYIAETEAAMSAQQESFEWPDIPKFEISWNLTETFDSAVETITGAWNAFVAGIKAAIGITAYSVTSIFMWPEITEFTLGWDVSEVFTEVQTTITNAWKEFRETLAYIFGAPMEVITDPDQVNAEWDQLVSDSHKFLEDSEAGFSHIDKFMWPTIPEFTLGWDVSKVLSGVGDTISTAWSSFRSSVSHIFGKERREIEKESEANLNTRSSIGDPRSDFEQYWTEDDLKRIRQSEELMAEVAASKERTDAILQGVVDDFKTGMDLGAIQGEKNAEEFIESIESFEWPTIPDFTLGWDIGARLTEVQTTISAAWNGFIVDIKSLLGIDGEGNSAITDIFEWPTIPEFELGWDVNEVFTEVQTTITNAWKEFRETLAYIFGAPMEVITDPDQVNAEWDQLVSDSHKFLEDSEAGFSHIDKFMWPTIPEFELDWDISTVLTGIGTVISESWNAFTASVGSLFGSEDGGEKKNAFEWPKIPEFAEDFDASDVGKTIVDSITAAWEWAGKNVGDWGAILMSILSSAWTGLVDISSLWGSMLRLWLTSVWDWVKSNPTEGWGQKILEILSAAWDKVLDIKSVWGPKILTWLDETWTWIKDSYPDWSETVITILENAWNAITGVAEKWGPIIGKWLSESWDWVRKNKPVKDEMSKYMEDFEIPQFEMEDPKAAEIINQDKLLTSMDKISELFGNSWINILSKNLFPKMNVVFGNAIILAAEYASDEAYENQTFINAIGRIAGFAIGHLTAAFIALPFELISKAANALLTGFGAIVQFALGIKIEDDRPQIEKISENFVDVFWTAIIDAWTARWEKFKEEMLDSLYYLEEILALFEGGELSEPSFDEIQEKKSQKRLDKEYLDLAEGTPEPKRRGFWHYGVEPFRNAMSQIGEAQTIQTQTNAFWYENWIINLGIFSQGVDLQWEQFLLNEETGFSALGASQLEREEANTLFWDNWILGLQAWNNGTALEWQINAEEQKAWMDKQAAKWSQFKLDMGLRWKATAEKFKDKFLIPMGTRMQKFVIDTELFGIDSLSKWYLFVHDPWKLAMNAFGALWEDMGEKIDGVIDSIETNVKRVKDAIDEIKKFSISDLNPFKNRNKNKDTTDYADRIRTDIATSRYTKNLRMWDAASQKNISLEDYYEKYGNSAGTSYWGGGVTMVGESGPELVTLPRGSRIDNAGQTNQMVNRKDDGMGEGGKTVNQTFNIMVEQDESGVRDWEDFAAFQAAI